MAGSRTSTPRSRYACQAAPASANRPNSTKFASLGTAVSPCAGSAATIRSRSALIAATLASSSGACASATRATAWVSAERWYGSRTSCTASTTAGSAAR